jgi:hypothetical protein
MVGMPWSHNEFIFPTASQKPVVSGSSTDEQISQEINRYLQGVVNRLTALIPSDQSEILDKDAKSMPQLPHQANLEQLLKHTKILLQNLQQALTLPEFTSQNNALDDMTQKHRAGLLKTARATAQYVNYVLDLHNVVQNQSDGITDAQKTALSKQYHTYRAATVLRFNTPRVEAIMDTIRTCMSTIAITGFLLCGGALLISMGFAGGNMPSVALNLVSAALCSMAASAGAISLAGIAQNIGGTIGKAVTGEDFVGRTRVERACEQQQNSSDDEASSENSAVVSDDPLEAIVTSVQAITDTPFAFFQATKPQRGWFARRYDKLFSGGLLAEDKDSIVTMDVINS